MLDPAAGDLHAQLPLPGWCEDSAALACCRCGTAFTMLLRRHHCRACGEVFCNKCLTLKPLPQFGLAGPEKVCLACAVPRVLRCPPLPTQGGEVGIVAHNALPECVQGEAAPRTLAAAVLVWLDGHSCPVVRVDAAGPAQCITCRVPPGTGRGRELVLQVGELRSCAEAHYAPPVVAGADSVPTEGVRAGRLRCCSGGLTQWRGNAGRAVHLGRGVWQQRREGVGQCGGRAVPGAHATAAAPDAERAGAAGRGGAGGGGAVRGRPERALLCVLPRCARWLRAVSVRATSACGVCAPHLRASSARHICAPGVAWPCVRLRRRCLRAAALVVAAPQVDALTAMLHSGGMVRIEGDNFGAHPALITVHLDGVPLRPADVWLVEPHGVLRCRCGRCCCPRCVRRCSRRAERAPACAACRPAQWAAALACLPTGAMAATPRHSCGSRPCCG